MGVALPLRSVACLLASATIVIGVAQLKAQEPKDDRQLTFRSAIDMVTIQASVRDTRGRTVQGLTLEDFQVWDNGQLRPVLNLRSDHESPVSLGILVDMSGSMRIAPKVAMARQAFAAVLQQLRNGQDEAAVFTFDSSLHERVGFTTDLGTLTTALTDFRPFGATSLYDATAEAARRLAERPSTHRAIVVLTDGSDTSSTLTAADVSGLASSINVPVYVIATVPSIDRRVAAEAADRSPASGVDLRDLADWTGGRFVFASTLTESVMMATAIVDELRQQYILAIESASEREWRRLDIRVRNSAATVKARSGYFGG